MGLLYQGSEDSLSWQDYDGIGRVVDKRNGLAHRGEIVESQDCMDFIERIRVELEAWGIISTPAK